MNKESHGDGPWLSLFIGMLVSEAFFYLLLKLVMA